MCEWYRMGRNGSKGKGVKEEKENKLENNKENGRGEKNTVKWK